MTDSWNAGEVREVLLTAVPAAQNSGLVREALLANATAATIAALAREILLVGDPAGGAQQYAVTVVS